MEAAREGHLDMVALLLDKGQLASQHSIASVGSAFNSTKKYRGFRGSFTD